MIEEISNKQVFISKREKKTLDWKLNQMKTLVQKIQTQELQWFRLKTVALIH